MQENDEDAIVRAVGTDEPETARGELLERTRDGGVAILEMRYAPHNLMDQHMVRAIMSGLQWAADEGARAVLLKSSLRHFSAGADLNEISGGVGDEGAELMLAFLESLRSTPIPIVAAVHGVCVGGGFEAALACDFIIAAQSAKFGCVEAIVGLHPLMGAVQRIAQRAGEARAKEMAMLGRRYDADTLERWNVINRVVPDDRLATAAMVLAQELANGPTVAHAATKRLSALAVSEGVAAADRAMFRLQDAIFASEDFAGAVASFNERGPGFAVFRGR